MTLEEFIAENADMSQIMYVMEKERERERGSFILFKIKALRGIRAQRKKVCEYKIKNCQAKVKKGTQKNLSTRQTIMPVSQITIVPYLGPTKQERGAGNG